MLHIMYPSPLRILGHIVMTSPDQTTAPQTHAQKYKDTVDRYSATLYRSTFAIKKDLELGLQQCIRDCGARSLSELLSVMATSPAEFGALLNPTVTAAKERMGLTKTSKVTFKQLLDKAQTLTPEEIAAALEAAAAKKSSGG